MHQQQLRAGLGARALRQPAVRAGTTRRQTAGRVMCGAEKYGIDKKFGKEKPGFRYDPSMQRWVRDKRVNLAYDDKEFDPYVRPKTGAPYILWPIQHSELMDYKLKSVAAQEIVDLQKKGAVVVDVREAPQFAKIHAEGAISCPLFIPVQGNGFWDIAKKVAMAGFAMEATERNVNFGAELAKLVPKNKTVILMCATGGTLETQITKVSGGTKATGMNGRIKKKVYNDPDRNFGRESRSLKACYETLQAGYKKIIHVEGGLNQWRFDDFPCEEK